MYQAVEILVPIASLLTIFGIVYISVTASHRKKMALIERGINPDVQNKKDRIKDMFMAIFIPIGLIIGFFFQEAYPKMEGPFPYLIFGLMFAGIGQLVSVLYKRNKRKSEANFPSEL